MPRIAAPKPEQVPAESQPTLGAFTKNIGFTPNMMTTFALSPIAFNAWATLLGNLSKALDVKTRDSIGLAVSEVNGCNYCLTVHSFTAEHMAKLPADEIILARKGQRPAPSTMRWTCPGQNWSGRLRRRTASDCRPVGSRRPASSPKPQSAFRIRPAAHGKVEQGSVTQSSLPVQPEADRPHLLRLQCLLGTHYASGIPRASLSDCRDQILNVPSIPPFGHIGRRKGAARRRQSDNSTTESAAEDRSGWNHRPSWVGSGRSAFEPGCSLTGHSAHAWEGQHGDGPL
jgi:AhpD family alkylhydroperoxidase